MLDLTVYDFICFTRTDAQCDCPLSSAFAYSYLSLPHTCICVSMSQSAWLSLGLSSLGGALLTCEFCEFANFITGAIGFTVSPNLLKTVRTKAKS